MSLAPTNVDHEAAYQDLCKLVDKYGGKLTAYEILAIASNLVGKLVAMQDQRKVTPAHAMEVVAKNIEYGNRMVLDQVGRSKGSA